jgi:hypothetical protein
VGKTRRAAAHQGLGLAVLGFGLRHGLVGAVEALDQVIELAIAVDLPPGAAGEASRIGLAPALGLLELRRVAVRGRW